MKYIILIIGLFLSAFAMGQSKGYLRYDSLYIIRPGGNAELILENGTKSVTGGVLTNVGNGRTRFITPAGSTNTSLGSAFKVAVDQTNNVKSLAAGEFMLLDSLTTGQIGITNAGRFGWTGQDTANAGHRHVTIPQEAKVGGRFGSIMFSNRNNNGDSAAFFVNPWPTTTQSEEPSMMYFNKNYKEAWGDTANNLQYGGFQTLFLDRSFDSASTRFRYDNKHILLPNSGIFSTAQFIPPRDSVRWLAGQDGGTFSPFSGYMQIGTTWGYDLDIYSSVTLPRYPISISHMTLDLQRTSSRLHPNGRHMNGNGIAAYSFNFKSWQQSISAATVDKGDYINKVYGYHMYGTTWRTIGTTKSDIIAVSAIDSVFALYSEPQYLETNEVVNGYGVAMMGDSDYNYMAGFLRVGSTLPSRPYGGRAHNRPLAKFEVYGSMLYQDGNQGSGKVLTSDANGIASWQTPSGGGGSGTVTNVATGLGLSGGPITTTGTIIADTSYLVTKSTPQVISGAKNFTAATLHSNALNIEYATPILTIKGSTAQQINMYDASNLGTTLFTNASGYDFSVRLAGWGGAAAIHADQANNSVVIGGGTTAAARLQIAAGTTALGSLKIDEGAKTTTAVDGAIEKDDAFYMTKTNAVRYGVGGNLNTNVTTVGNVGTGEDNLMTYTIPAGTLSQDGDRIEFTMSFSVAANSTLKVYFGAQQLFSLAALATDAVYRVIGEVYRTGAATQRATFQVIGGLGTFQAGYQLPTETLSGTVVLKATGEGTSNNDITQTTMGVKFFPNN